MVFAVDDVFPPLLIVHIPVDGLLYALIKGGLRAPAELDVNLCRVNGIAQDMTGSVLDKDEKGLKFAHDSQNRFDNIYIALLIVTADIVDLAYPAVMNNEIDSAAVILNIEPVADIESLAVDRQALVVIGS